MNAIIISEEQYLKLLNKIDDLLAQVNSKKFIELQHEYFTNKELSKLLDVSFRTLQNWRDEGRISFSQIGNKIYYKAQDIEEFILKHRISS